MLKVLHLQTGLPTAGNAAFRLHEAMLNSNISSKMLAFETTRPTNTRVATYTGLKKYIKTKLYKLWAHFVNSKKKPGTYLFSNAKYVGNDVASHYLVNEADIIYLHWVVGGFLTLSDIEKVLKLNKPVFFFLHDMWTITGGCHHSFECTNYQTGCHYCPIFKGDKKLSYASEQFIAKKKIFSRYSNIYFLSPSNWLADCARHSGLTSDKPVFCVPNVIDETFFKPFNKSVAKQILNLNNNVKVITFGCIAGPGNKFKGWQYLEDALNIVYRQNLNCSIEIMIYGSEYDEATVNAIPYPVKFLGRLYDETTMVVVDNATDIFVSPSLAESFGLAFLENILCNTPVVGFEVGGTPDIIKHKINGYLATYKSAEDLANGILYFLNNKIEVPQPTEFYTDVIMQKYKAVMDLSLQV